MYISFLNEEVKNEVLKSPALYLAWRLLYGRYDDDIDPMHNLDWVRLQKKIEANNLVRLKAKAEDILKELT